MTIEQLNDESNVDTRHLPAGVTSAAMSVGLASLTHRAPLLALLAFPLLEFTMLEKSVPSSIYIFKYTA